MSKRYRAVTEVASKASRIFAVAMLAGLSASAATDVWIGTNSGTWSTGTNWLSGSPPASGGGLSEVLQFTGSGSASIVATNDLPGIFSLSQLTSSGVAPFGNISLLGNSLQLAGDNPAVQLDGAGSLTIQSGLVLNPTTGSATIRGAGSGNFTISGPISQAGGSRSLVLATTPASLTTQLVTLSGSNTFAGGINLQSGNLVLNSNGALGTGPLLVNGGSLRLGSVTVANAISLNQRLLLPAVGTATLSGVISSATPGTGLELRQAGGTLSLTGASTYTGETVVTNSLFAGSALATAGTLRLTGSGSILGSSTIRVEAGALLQIDNAITGVVNRLADDATLILRSGRVTYGSTSGSTAQVETVGALNGAGFSTLTIANTGMPGTRLVFSQIASVERGTFLFTGNKLGSPFAANVGNILFTTAPPGLIGGAGTGSATSILPYAIGDTISGGPGTSFVTYSAATGIRPLDLTTEYSSDLGSALPTTNVRLTTAVLSASPTTINSLVLSGATLSGQGVITVNSGAILSTLNSSSVANDLSFGAREAEIFTVGALTLSGTISGSGGLTKSANNTLSLTGVNTFTGPLMINAGSINFASVAALGADPSAIVINRTSAGLTYSGATPLTFTRPIETRTGMARLGTNGADLSFAGGISGAGGVTFFSGLSQVTLAQANTYTGPTSFAGGVARLGSDSALGNGGGVDFSGGRVLLSNAWNTARAISVTTTGAIDTNGFNAAWSGELSGAGAFEKTGSGTLALTGRAAYTGAISVTGGALKLSGAGSLATSSLGVQRDGQLVIDHSDDATIDRVLDTGTVTVTGGDLQLIGNTSARTSETIGSVATADGSAGAITLIDPGTSGTILRLKSGLAASTGSLLVRGQNLGGSVGGSFTRLVSDTAIPAGTVVTKVIADSSSSGLGESFTVYNGSVDAAGVIGYRALSADEYASGSQIANALNGGTTSTAANFLASGGSTASGAGNTIQSLTLQGGGNLTLDPTQTVSITSGGVLTRAGGLVSISGGTLSFGAAPGVIYTASDAVLTSTLTGTAGLKKSGPGALTINGSANFAGDAAVLNGTLRLGQADLLASHLVSVGTTGILAFSTSTVSVGALSGTGEVAIGSSSLTVGALGTNFTFGGSLTGNGTLIITDGDNPSAIRSFGGAGAFGGSVVLNSGQLSFVSAAPFGSAPITVNGGSVGGTSNLAIAPQFFLNTDLVFAPGSTVLAPGTTITGAHDVVVPKNSHVEIRGPLSLSGQLRAPVLSPTLSFPIPVAISIQSQAGSLVNATGVRIDAGAVFELDARFSQAAPSIGLIADNIPVQLNAATLNLIGDFLNTSETLGAISGSGLSTLLVTPQSTTSTTLLANGLNRVQHGTFLLTSSTNVLGGPSGANVAQIRTATAPLLIGGGGTGPATSILPWALAQTTVGQAISFLATYDANGFRPLAATEYATSLATAGATDNLQLTVTANVVADQTVNSLTLTGGHPDLTGSGKLTVSSGAILYTASAATTIDSPLSFGSAEGEIFLPSSSVKLTINGEISGTGGLTKSGTGPLILTAPNSFTGPVTINGGILSFPRGTSLGTGNADLTLAGNDATLLYTGTQALSISRNIVLDSGISIISSGGGSTLSLDGVLSGAGGLRIQGVITKLGSNNTYQGPTYIAGSAAISGDGSFGNSTSPIYFASSASLRLDANWSTVRRLELQALATIDTNGHDLTINGTLLGSGTQQLTKNGAGTINLNTASIFSGAVTVNVGQLKLGGSGTLASTNYFVEASAGVVLQNGTLARNDRVSDSAHFYLDGGDLRLEGNAGAPVSETAGLLTGRIGTINTVSLTAPGAFPTTLILTNPTDFGSIFYQGDRLGGTGGNSTRVLITSPLQIGGLVPGALASSSLAGGSFALATYDTSSDPFGMIGLRALRPSEFTSASEIRNPINGGSISTAANFRAAGAISAGGSTNSVNSLTFGSGAALGLQAGQTLRLGTPVMVVEAGGAASLTGGTLDFGSMDVVLHTDSDFALRSTLLASSLMKSGAGDLLFAPPTPFNGRFFQTAGNVHIGPGDALAGAQVTVAAATILDFGNNPASVVSLNSSGTVRFGATPLRIRGDPTGTTVSSFLGDLIGTGGVEINGRISLNVPVAYTGPTIVSGEHATSSSAPTYTLRAGGSALGTSSLVARGQGVIAIDNSLQVLTRLSAVPVALNSSELYLAGNTQAASTQILGAVTASGFSTLRLKNATGQQAVILQSSNFTRQDRAGVLFANGDTSGSGVLGDGQSLIRLGSSLTTDLVGANTTATNRPVIPYAVGYSAGAYGLVTYDETYGVRSLTSGEYSTSLTAGDNVALPLFVPPMNSDVSINSLVLNGSIVSGTGNLLVQSGAVLSTNSTSTLYNNLLFGSREGNILLANSLALNGAISGTNGLTVSGFGTLTLAGVNTFSGPLTVNRAILAFSSLDQLGPDSSAITLNDGTLKLASGALTLSRALNLTGYGFSTLSGPVSGSTPFLLSGTVAGTGGLTIDGLVSLTGHNTFSGDVKVLGTLLINGDPALGVGPNLTLGDPSRSQAQLTLSGPWTTSHATQLNGNASIDTNGNDAVLGGSITGATGRSLTKLGSGRLIANDLQGLVASITAAAGELRLNGNAPALLNLSAGAGSILSGSLQTNASVTVSGQLSPGDGVGRMKTGALSFTGNSTLDLELNSPTSFDQVEAASGVTLNSSVNLSLELGYDPADAVDRFTIILNDGPNPIILLNSGKLSYGGIPLAEGQTFLVGDQTFRITYAGGDGNDVELLAVVPEPASALTLTAGLLTLHLRRRRIRPRSR